MNEDYYILIGYRYNDDDMGLTSAMPLVCDLACQEDSTAKVMRNFEKTLDILPFC